jgi:peptide/nickel transport system ATP-binding protein
VAHAEKVFDERQRRYVIAGELSGRQVRAVNDVSLELGTHETLALVGESGCGKTTLTRMIIGLLEPTKGAFEFEGSALAKDVRQRSARVRQELQIVFQNPDSSLNPRQTVFQIIARPLELFHNLSGDALRKRVGELLELVKLDVSYTERYPAQLSGGEKQRVAIARAFASDPSLVLCDEAVSALDVSVQASILNLLVQLQQERGASFLFVSHDLGVVQYVADRIAVMYLGEIVESGSVEQVFAPPYHPYTEALLSAIPVPDPRIKQKHIRLEGSVPSPADEITGCPFHTRCPRRLGEICITTPPPVREAEDGHYIRCHIPLEELRNLPSVVEQGGRVPQ